MQPSWTRGHTRARQAVNRGSQRVCMAVSPRLPPRCFPSSELLSRKAAAQRPSLLAVRLRPLPTPPHCRHCPLPSGDRQALGTALEPVNSDPGGKELGPPPGADPQGSAVQEEAGGPERSGRVCVQWLLAGAPGQARRFPTCRREQTHAPWPQSQTRCRGRQGWGRSFCLG